MLSRSTWYLPCGTDLSKNYTTMRAYTSQQLKPTYKSKLLHRCTLLFATVTCITYFLGIIPVCHSFAPTHLHHLVHCQTTIQRKNNVISRNIFRELIMEDGEDLRAEIAAIEKPDGLDSFLQEDDRLCVIKLHAPYCKACRAFGIKFRKIAMEKGDLINTAKEKVRAGDARFGAIDYASNVKLCKNLGVKKFPTVLIFRGGEKGTGGGRGEKLREIVCKQSAVEDIVGEIDELLSMNGR